MGDWRSGSATPLHGEGRRFKSYITHQLIKLVYFFEKTKKLNKINKFFILDF